MMNLKRNISEINAGDTLTDNFEEISSKKLKSEGTNPIDDSNANNSEQENQNNNIENSALQDNNYTNYTENTNTENTFELNLEHERLIEAAIIEKFLLNDYPNNKENKVQDEKETDSEDRIIQKKQINILEPEFDELPELPSNSKKAPNEENSKETIPLTDEEFAKMLQQQEDDAQLARKLAEEEDAQLALDLANVSQQNVNNQLNATKPPLLPPTMKVGDNWKFLLQPPQENDDISKFCSDSWDDHEHDYELCTGCNSVICVECHEAETCEECFRYTCIDCQILDSPDSSELEFSFLCKTCRD